MYKVKYNKGLIESAHGLRMPGICDNESSFSGALHSGQRIERARLEQLEPALDWQS